MPVTAKKSNDDKFLCESSWEFSLNSHCKPFTHITFSVNSQKWKILHGISTGKISQKWHSQRVGLPTVMYRGIIHFSPSNPRISVHGNREFVNRHCIHMFPDTKKVGPHALTHQLKYHQIKMVTVWPTLHDSYNLGSTDADHLELPLGLCIPFLIY